LVDRLTFQPSAYGRLKKSQTLAFCPGLTGRTACPVIFPLLREGRRTRNVGFPETQVGTPAKAGQHFLKSEECPASLRERNPFHFLSCEMSFARRRSSALALFYSVG